MRPGRFDVEVVVDIPDYSSRKEIFDLYLSKILTQDVDTSYLAKCTVGFTGADIENMVFFLLYIFSYSILIFYMINLCIK